VLAVVLEMLIASNPSAVPSGAREVDRRLDDDVAEIKSPWLRAHALDALAAQGGHIWPPWVPAGILILA
jgi:hypothetical protein